MSKFIEEKNLNSHNIMGLITGSKKMLEVVDRVEKVSSTEASIFLQGASGTGKELLARFAHFKSRRAQGRLVTINCATLDSQLMSSELFGHTRGAFTGAVRDHKGLLSQANGGSLFLDEIAEMPIDIQAKLLRTIQEKKYAPIGTTLCHEADIRFISATHRCLLDMVEDNLFREDLMYRIRVIPIRVPPLIERDDDVEILVWELLKEFLVRGYRKVVRIEDKAYDALLSYSWPGNVRELRNNIEFSLAVGDGDALCFKDLSSELQGNRTPRNRKRIERYSDFEREEILSALKKFKGKKGPASESLGISRATLWRKMKHYNIG